MCAHLIENGMVLTELFNQMWGQIRQANLCAGQPQSAASRESLSIARQALSVATEAQDDHLLTEAWCMMAYALNVNDEYVEALSYYRLAVQGLDQAGDHKRAARTRLGFINALSMTGQSREALLVGREASVLFSQHQDSASLAKLATNLGTVYQRLDDPQRAVAFFSEAADLFGQIGDERGLAQVYLNLGNTSWIGSPNPR
jgi:tetratricopeptide (TPR) repeat protein